MTDPSYPGKFNFAQSWMMTIIFGMQINIDIFYKLILSIWVCKARHAQSIQNKKFVYLCNISRKMWEMKFIFYLQINTKVFYNSVVSLWVCIVSHAQSTQNNKFAISLKYLQENFKDEVDFLSADKHWRFL